MREPHFFTFDGCFCKSNLKFLGGEDSIEKLSGRTVQSNLSACYVYPCLYSIFSFQRMDESSTDCCCLLRLVLAANRGVMSLLIDYISPCCMPIRCTGGYLTVE
jgi:hypothetical protein